MIKSEDSDIKNKSEENEEILVEVPQGVGNILMKKSQLSSMDIRAMVVRCTICRSQVNHNDVDKIKKHFRLDVLVCKDCYDFYGTSEFSQDESGNYNYCTWCGNGGKLYLCDFCPNSFCSSCVHHNFGRAAVAEMSKDGWQCYVCKPQLLTNKKAFCDMIVEYCKQAKAKKDKKIASKKVIHNNEMSWMNDAFDKSDDAIKNFQRKIRKLRNIEVAKSKSIKHIIKKWEEVVETLKKDMKSLVSDVSVKYKSFVEMQAKKEEIEMNASIVENGLPKLIHPADNVEVLCGKGEKPVIIENDSTSKELIPNKVTEENDLNLLAKMNLIAGSSSGSECEVTPNLNISPPVTDANECEVTPKLNSSLLLTEANECEVTPNLNISSPVTEANECEVTSNLNISPPVTEANECEVTPNLSISPPVTDTNECEITQNLNNSPSVIDKKEEPIVLDSDSDKSSTNFCDFKFSDSSSEASHGAKVRKQIYKLCESGKSGQPVVLNHDDPKLKLNVCVTLTNCDDLIPNGETTIPLPLKYRFEEIDESIRKICKMPKIMSKEAPVETKKSSVDTKVEKKRKRKESSSSISFSSSDEPEAIKGSSIITQTPGATDINLVKPIVINDSGSDDIFISSASDSDIKSKKLKKAPLNKNSDSSDDFQPRKKKKFDKLLAKRFLSDAESSKENSRDASEKEKKFKKVKKRSPLENDGGKNSSDSTSTSSESEKETKKKRKSRIKKAATSSSEDGEKDGSQTTPNKSGRKNIKKIISKDALTGETKEAQQQERERRKRVQERQKLYNQIVDIEDGKEAITRKLVLEVDSVSKEEIEIHPDIVDKLKPHQVNGVKFMWECAIESLDELQKNTGSGCILAHCMGLGKTLQVISFLHTCLNSKFINKKIRTAMIICPYNTLMNWAKEFDKWLDDIDGDIVVHELVTAKSNYDRYGIIKYWHKEGGVLIINYDCFRRLAAAKVPKLKPKERENLKKYLLEPGADIVVCDEGHMLKNEKSAISKACALMKTQRRIVLTGTPLQNNLNEYHCMMSFVKPNLLGTAKEFRNRFVNPIMNGQYEDSNEHDVRRMKKRIHILHKLLEGCVQRCDYSALTKFLPPKHEFVISVKLSDIQTKMYKLYLENNSILKSKCHGTTLFKDYNLLLYLCAHPYIVHTSHQKAEMKRLLRDDDEEEEMFINDESESSHKSSHSNSGSSSEDEVVRSYKTRSRKKDSDAESVDSVPEEVKKEWYHEFISDEDKCRIEISGKMVLMVDILKECEAIGDKCILFSQSLMTLDCVEDVLSNLHEQELSVEDKQRDISCSWIKGIDYYRMDGATSADNRKLFIDMFNDPANDRARLFLVSTKAGGLGTNLVGANRVIMLDCSWNPSHDVQAIFRVYRFGQKKPVYIYRLLGQATMEEKIYDRQVTKLSLSIRVVDEQQIDRHFNAAELSELYTFEPDTQKNRPTPMVPNDRILAEMLIKNKDWIVTYHEHDSLLQNQTEEDLTEEERKAAWDEYENEREGIQNMNDYFDPIQTHCAEPDFTQADYEGNIIDLSKIIPDIIRKLREKYPSLPQLDIRMKLYKCIYDLRSIYQEKHLKLLRMKQDFVSRGSTPVSVNKYLAELSTALTELSKHCQELKKMIDKENHNKYMEQMKTMQNVRQNAMNFVRLPNPGMLNQMPQFAARYAPGTFVANMHMHQQQLFNQMIKKGMPMYVQSSSSGVQPYANMSHFNTQPKTYSKPPDPIITEVADEKSTEDASDKNKYEPIVVIEEVE